MNSSLKDLFPLSERVEAEVSSGNLTRTQKKPVRAYLPDLFAPLPGSHKRKPSPAVAPEPPRSSRDAEQPCRGRTTKGFFRGMKRALSGVVYDVRHLRSLPGKHGPARFACACTRQGRWKYLLVIFLGIMLFGVFLSLIVNTSRASRNGVALSGGGGAGAPGSSFRSTRSPPLVGADTGSFPLGVTV